MEHRQSNVEEFDMEALKKRFSVMGLHIPVSEFQNKSEKEIKDLYDNLCIFERKLADEAAKYDSGISFPLLDGRTLYIALIKNHVYIYIVDEEKQYVTKIIPYKELKRLEFNEGPHIRKLKRNGEKELRPEAAYIINKTNAIREDYINKTRGGYIYV
jgi:hypothetical protein